MLPDHEIAADIKQDLLEAGFDTEIAEAAAIQLALAVERGHQDRVCGGLDCGFDEFGSRRERSKRYHLVAGGFQRHRQDPVADDVGVGADDAGDERFPVRGHRIRRLP